MKAILCQAYGAPESLVLAEIDSPDPGPGQVKIKVRACSVNFPDLLMIQGLYQFKPPLPFSPGLEVAGEISAIGAGVNHVKLGDRVVAIMDHGGFAEEAVTASASLLPMPADMPYPMGAVFPLAYGTAHLALAHRGQLQAGETLLVLGAAGGVGLAAVEVGKLLGARVIAAASTGEKLALARAKGADEITNYAEDDLRDGIIDLTRGKGADVIFDPVGADLFDIAARRIAWEGRYLVIGFAGGRIPSLPANIALLKNASLVGVYWGAYLAHDPGTLRQSHQKLLEWHADGRLHPHVGATYPLAAAARALRDMMNRRALGKLVLTT